MLDLALWYTAAVVTATRTALTAITSARVQQERGKPALRALWGTGANGQYVELSTPSMGQYNFMARGVALANTLPQKGAASPAPVMNLVPSENMTATYYQDSGGNELGSAAALISYGTPNKWKGSDKPAITFRWTIGTAPTAAVLSTVETDVFSGARELIPGKKYGIISATYLAADALYFGFKAPSFGANMPGGHAASDVGQEMIDFVALGDVPVFVAGESVSMHLLGSGATQGVAIVTVQEV